MERRIENNVVNGATTKKKYVSPEIEVINLDEQPRLLSASAVPSSFGAGFGSDDEESW